MIVGRLRRAWNAFLESANTPATPLLRSYFDANRYLVTNPDVRAGKRDPLEHYLRHGWREGRNPLALFDVRWYLQQNPDVLSANVEPLTHYIEHGWREARDPHPLFDTAWYLRQNPDVAEAGLEPLKHYLDLGWRSGLNPHPFFNAGAYRDENPDVKASDVEPLEHFLDYGRTEGRTCGLSVRYSEDGRWLGWEPATVALSRTPLVSIIIANYNGIGHLPDLFASLANQTYRNFEIIFVDDNSSDQSPHVAAQLGARVVRTQSSVGFAEANNIGLRNSRGELIALLNNDTKVDSMWLEHLVETMKQDRAVGVVTPKIRFWSDFQRVKITGRANFSIVRRDLLSSLDYKKYFVRRGTDEQEDIVSELERDDHICHLDLPIQKTEICLHIKADQDQLFSVQAGTISISLRGRAGSTRYALVFEASSQRDGFYIINNAGGIEQSPLQPADRGYAEVDEGQFDRADYVAFFCGCSALIRRDALRGKNLFIKELVAYYEDSELSFRMRDNGYKIAYCPAAVVYHKHSATMVEQSAFWRKQIGKNSIIFEYLFSPRTERDEVIRKGKDHLNHVRHFYQQNSSIAAELEFAVAVPEMCKEIDDIVVAAEAGRLVRSNGPRFGLYNSHWSTLGDGEAHAPDIANAMQSFGMVEVIGDSEFDLEHLCRSFGIDLRNMRKRIVPKITSAITSEYDVFVDSTFQSGLDVFRLFIETVDNRRF